MKRLDRIIQMWRVSVACRHLKNCACVIDVGAHQGELFRKIGGSLIEGYGIDPLTDYPVSQSNFSIHRGLFPHLAPTKCNWDAITMLAVLEHIPRADHSALADACYNLLKPGGLVIITVPSKAVDFILQILRSLRIIDGMSLEEHYGFSPRETLGIFSSTRFEISCNRRFQFGLNNLFVFKKI